MQSERGNGWGVTINFSAGDCGESTKHSIVRSFLVTAFTRSPLVYLIHSLGPGRDGAGHTRVGRRRSPMLVGVNEDAQIDPVHGRYSESGMNLNFVELPVCWSPGKMARRRKKLLR